MEEKHLTRAILIGADTGEYDAESSMDELSELAKTAGAEELARVLQKREAYEPATVIGEGKLAEVKELCGSLGAELLIFDCELTASQIRNVEDETDVRVIDRTMLILDIFAQRARTREGRLQVELAQYKYLLPRLMGMWTHLERQGGSSGGDDALALVIHKLTGWKLSRAYLFTDLTVLLASLSYIPVRRIAFSLVTVTVSSLLIDWVKEYTPKNGKTNV